MAKQYTVTITFSGLATLTMEGESIGDIREQALGLKIEDLARQGHAEITHFKVGARDVILRGSTLLNEDEEEAAPQKPRPSGWYRPA